MTTSYHQKIKGDILKKINIGIKKAGSAVKLGRILTEYGTHVSTQTIWNWKNRDKNILKQCVLNLDKFLQKKDNE